MSQIPHTFQARWRFRKSDPEQRRPLRLVWTCCDSCHSEHRTLFAARVHYLLLKIRGEA